MKNAIVIGYQKDGKIHVLHMVLYESTPTEVDIASLKKELREDEEFKEIFDREETIEAFMATVDNEEVQIHSKIEW